MFDRCDFLVGQDNSMVIVLPGLLPKGVSSYTVSASPSEISIKAGFNEIARFPYKNENVFRILTMSSQVGIVEYPPKEVFPNAITALAYVETRH
jgi:hypothetical protein